MFQDDRRKTEVNIRTLTKDEQQQMTQAKKLEAEQWISNTVFTVAKRAGIPKHRIMSMRWILTWKKVDNASPKAKARLVVKGFTDPDLTTLRAESLTLPHIMSQRPTSVGGLLQDAPKHGRRQDSLSPR